MESFKSKPLRIGIDASNLRQGGGRTHLIELLAQANPRIHNFEKVIVWGSSETLNLLVDQDWLVKVGPSALKKGLLIRTLWQRFSLSKEARIYKCDLLFIPGGGYSGSFSPVVTMSQNLLPFELSELRRYGLSMTSMRLILLRYFQSFSFRRSSGIIFLTHYAKDVVQKVTGSLKGATAIIPHGIGKQFSSVPKAQCDISMYSEEKPYRLIYISTVEFYKHQDKLIEALAILRKKTGWPIKLELAGPSSSLALGGLKKAIKLFDPNELWVKYYGAVDYQKVSSLYLGADAAIFASSCENLPIILLESMGAGLPIACSSRGPMPEVLKDSGIYFDPLSINSIVDAVQRLISLPKLRTQIAIGAYKSAQSYSWASCANDTFNFFNEVFQEKNI